MAKTITFFVDDTSPSVSYSPFSDTLSTPNLPAGWNPLFDSPGFATAPGVVGHGTSYHITSSNGATVSLQWKGTGIKLLGNATQADYTVSVDGVPHPNSDVDNILFDYQNLVDGDHTIILTAQIRTDITGSSILFDGANVSSTASIGPDVPFDQEPISNKDISFFGKWSSSDTVYNTSSTKGDSVQAHFQGVVLLLYGKTSPTSGRYNVTIDNVTTTLSSQSSYMDENALLFFASGLSPNETHNLEVSNIDDRDLSLKMGGFEVFAAGSASFVTFPPPPYKNLGLTDHGYVSSSDTGPPQPEESTSVPVTHQKGTTAALVLAGILVFLILTGLLLYFFVIRPRKRRLQNARAQRRTKENEGLVLDISQVQNDVELGSTQATPGHRASGKSGFSRWKWEVEGGLESLGIGIAFRHSDSTAPKPPSHYDTGSEPLSNKSSRMTLSSRLSSKPSSKASKGKGKKKSRAHVSESSWSPSFALELPVRPPSGDSYKDKDVGQSRLLPEEPHSIISDLTSLSYMSSPSTVHRSLSPPSYSISSSVRKATSMPRSTPSSDRHERSSSQGALLAYDASQGDDTIREYEPYVSALSPPSSKSRDDHGSAQYSSDDTTSFIGPSATRSALRGLSPRTSEFIEPRPLDQGTSSARKTMSSSPLAGGSKSRSDTSPSRYDAPKDKHDSPEKTSKRETQSTVPPVKKKFLSFRATSPFEIDFPASPPPQLPQQLPRDNEAPASSTHLGAGDDVGKGKGKEIPPAKEEKQKQKPQKWFRLTPLTEPRAPDHARRESSSFLDFSSSSDASHRTQSVVTSEFSERLPKRSPKSRWSKSLTQATDLSRSDSSGTSLPPVSPPRSVFSGNFPYPVSLPPSPHHPEGHKHPPSSFNLPLQVPRAQQTHESTSAQAGVHPAVEEANSPTDSVPMSVSELKFRHSTSTASASHSTSSPLPPHPPLPGRVPHEDSESGTPGLSTPNYIVQRVLGQTSQSGLNASSSSFKTSSTPPPMPKNKHHNPPR